ncbi:MAG TPA: DUF5691 domain-containing protein [Gemmatimonadaceae bacterium]|nr:DUF5691 domain-containing protein [Gemmatimonadaceae bacterium]
MTTHATWNAIVQRAVLGTERGAAAAIPEVTSDLKSVLDRVDSSDAELALLSTAAIVSAYESAGRLPARTSSPPIEAATAEADDQPPASIGVARFLVTMLGGVNSEVLREWFAAVAARGWRVPTPMLPSLLDAGRGAPYLRSAILPILGARGRWLAARNDDWSYAAANPPAEDAALRVAWETGTPEERSAILAHARARNAALGRALLESTWADEAPSQRASLAALLATGLSLEDEPFLEQALDDRRQEVRRAAAELLGRLDRSGLVARMAARAHTALSWKPGRLLKKAEIIVEPPKELDATAARDGVEKKPPHMMGERAWWLTQIVAVVPPRVWSEKWNATPDAIISAAAAGDWTQALTEGWAAAAVLHRDAAWAESLLATGFPGEKPTSLAPKLSELLGVLAADRREAFVTRALRDVRNTDAAVTLVAAADHSWSEPFARAVLTWLGPRMVAALKAGGTAEWQLRDVIPRLALRVPPSLAGVATKNWPTNEEAGGLAGALDRFISLLTFRRELAEELDR